MATFITGNHAGFALRLLEARSELNRKRQEKQEEKLLQDGLAKAVGVSPRSISQYENGHMLPRPKILEKIADVLEVDPVWLKEGKSEAFRQFLVDQHTKGKQSGAIKQADLLFIEDWETLEPGPRGVVWRTYNPEPTNGSQSANIEDFVPVAKTGLDLYRAVRYPGIYPDNPGYPAGSILIFDAGVSDLRQVENGDLVIFRMYGEEHKASLRRYTCEPGMSEGFLVSVNEAMPVKPIPADPLTVDLFGVVVSQVIPR